MKALIGLGVAGLFIWIYEMRDQIVKTFREARDHNPCGVNKSHSQEAKFTGLVRDESGAPIIDGPLYIFQTDPDGLFAAADVLKNVTFGMFNAQNLNDIAYRWTGSYNGYTGETMAEKLGGDYSATAPVNFRDNGSDILWALAACENSEAYADIIPEGYYRDAVNKVL